MGLEFDGISTSAGAGVDEGVRRTETAIVGLRDLSNNAAPRTQASRMSHSRNVFHDSSLDHTPFLVSSTTLGTRSYAALSVQRCAKRHARRLNQARSSHHCETTSRANQA